MQMVIYLDVLLLLNLYLNFLILSGVQCMLRCRVGLLRQILAALLGAVSSLWILMPDCGWWVECGFRLAVAAGMMLVDAGFGNIWRFLRNTGALFAVSFGFGGGVYALYALVQPAGLTMRHGIVYYDLSPVVLIISSLVIYLCFWGGSRLFSGGHSKDLIPFTLTYGDRVYRGLALADTGQKLRDPFSDLPVVLLDKTVGDRFFPPPTAGEKIRMIPVRTAAGHSVLLGYYCSQLQLLRKGKPGFSGPVIAAVSAAPLTEDFDLLFSPEIMRKDDTFETHLFVAKTPTDADAAVPAGQLLHQRAGDFARAAESSQGSRADGTL